MARENILNFAKSTLSTAINNVVTSIPLTAGGGALFPTSEFFVSIDSEIMWCSTRAGDALTVLRGQKGTAAVSHSALAPVFHGLLAHHVSAKAEVMTFGVGTTPYTIPVGATRLAIGLLGGGGGGGSGTRRTVTTTLRSPGGGGAGASMTLVEVDPTTLTGPLSVVVGAGGVGGVGAISGEAAGTPGGNGGDTSVTQSGGAIVAYASGGRGGEGGAYLSGPVEAAAVTPIGTHAGGPSLVGNTVQDRQTRRGRGAPSGGFGGGVSTGNVASAGVNGVQAAQRIGESSPLGSGTGTSSVRVGGSGAAYVNPPGRIMPGPSGGGGGGSTTTGRGNGGDGGPGAGGGGGGGVTTNTVASFGGNGGAGAAVIIAYFD